MTTDAHGDTVHDIGSEATIHSGSGGSSGPGALEMGVRPLAATGERYSDKGQLGEGGMGEVRLMRDERIGRDVALKLIRGKANEGVALRFLREARVQAQLEHPAVVPVYDLGLTPDGRTFFTMKRVRGRSLETILDALAKESESTAALATRRQLLTSFSRICLALEYAHARGVLHRDLKPANVMLGDFGDIHLLDWGLAKVRGVADLPPEEGAVEVSASPGKETVAGSLLGTPGYMAPEQARGELDKIDARSDVYSLGAILFDILYLEMLHPVVGQAARLTSTVMGPPPFEGRKRHESVPPELVEIVKKATAMDPADRFRSARELSLAVERFLDGERDEARRRELAEGHVTRALELKKKGTPEERLGALRELGRALALDPSHEDALRALEEILRVQEGDVPDEAREELDASRRAQRGEHARAHFVRASSWLAIAPLVMAFGVISLPRAVALVATLVAGWVIALFVRRERSLDGPLGVALFASTALGIGLISFICGPFVVVPTLASTSAMFAGMMIEKRRRPFILGAFLLSFLVPAFLSFAGLEHDYYAFPDVRTMAVTSPMVELPPVLVLTFLVVVSVLAVLTPMTLVGRMHDRLAAAEERVFLQAWHLRQLLPKDRAPRTSVPA